MDPFSNDGSKSGTNMVCNIQKTPFRRRRAQRTHVLVNPSGAKIALPMFSVALGPIAAWEISIEIKIVNIKIKKGWRSVVAGLGIMFDVGKRT